MKRRAVIACVIALAAGATYADEPPIKVARRTEPGREVLIRGFAEFHGNCTLRRVQTITVVDAPAHGRVETRPGVVTIGPNWVGNGACEGTKLDGVQVFYVPAAGYTGSDRFSFDVGYQSNRKVRAEVEVSIAPK
jgi:hypothetical protein